MRRRLPLLLALVAVVGMVLWAATPRLLDRFAPAWSVTASLPTAASDTTVRAVDECLDVMASSRVFTDVEAGRLEANLHAMQWEVRRASSCLRRVPGVTDVAASKQ
jgi:Tfp pilus assembly protein PilN